MSTFAKRSRQERTYASVRAVTTFNTPGTYQPPYGKTVFQLEGRGATGNFGSADYVSTNPTNWEAFATYTRFPTPNLPGDTAFATFSGSSPGCPPNEGPTSDDIGVSWINYSCTPGSDNFTFTPGNEGTPANVLGVTLPGGMAEGGLAPDVPYTPVVIPFSNAGVSITVPPGGFVRIRNL